MTKPPRKFISDSLRCRTDGEQERNIRNTLNPTDWKVNTDFTRSENAKKI